MVGRIVRRPDMSGQTARRSWGRDWVDGKVFRPGGEGSQTGETIVVRPSRPDQYRPQSTDRSTNDTLSNSDEIEVNASDELEAMHFYWSKISL